MSLKLVSFLTDSKEDDIRTGALVGDTIVDLSALAAEEEGRPHAHCDLNVVRLLACDRALDWAAEVVENTDGIAADAKCAREEVKLLSPIPKPGKILCLATNYQSHLDESAMRRMSGSKPEIESPRVFMKPSGNTICGDGDPIWITRQSKFCDYEGELAVIIGRRCRYVKASDAMDYVGGVSCCNDVSERKLRVWERSEDKDWDKFFDWLNGKWFDNAFPMGPCVVPTKFVSDPHGLNLQTRVNGAIKQETSTGLMIFDIGQVIEFISELMTLEPGDIIATGTPAGVGSTDGTNLKPGDVVEVEISEIGTLTNPVQAEPES